MIQRQNPVEWVVDWPLAWLLTYSGTDCKLWRLVYSKCMGSELCRRLIELLLDDLAKHKCYVEDLDAEIIDQAPNHSHNNPNQPPQQHRTTRNHSNLKTKAPQLPKLSKSLSRPCPEPSLKPLKPTFPSPSPPT
jgi:hypothetical protein